MGSPCSCTGPYGAKLRKDAVSLKLHTAAASHAACSRGGRSAAGALRALVDQSHQEIIMSVQQRAAQGSAAAASPKFKDMGFIGKIVFIVKFVIFLCTFGFAFPTLLND